VVRSAVIQELKAYDVAFCRSNFFLSSPQRKSWVRAEYKYAEVKIKVNPGPKSSSPLAFSVNDETTVNTTALPRA